MHKQVCAVACSNKIIASRLVLSELKITNDTKLIIICYTSRIAVMVMPAPDRRQLTRLSGVRSFSSEFVVGSS